MAPYKLCLFCATPIIVLISWFTTLQPLIFKHTLSNTSQSITSMAFRFWAYSVRYFVNSTLYYLTVENTEKVFLKLVDCCANTSNNLFKKHVFCLPSIIKNCIFVFVQAICLKMLCEDLSKAAKKDWH